MLASAGFVAAWNVMKRTSAMTRMIKIVPMYGHASFRFRTISPKANGAASGKRSMSPIPQRRETADGSASGEAAFAE